ncbi:MAG: GIY-YIG nuclease family protein [Sphingobacteriales bacterium JAD_PAG50586_3]|nr:MAG: GIY-YIG nuclease family protein [Sphingobacteriales bacterium JAD_PAG50586_3]
MAYYVYIIESLQDGTLYKGFTENYIQRLEQHNLGLSMYTSSKTPWRLLYVEEFAVKRDALIKEKQLKRCNSNYLRWLATQPTNIIK